MEDAVALARDFLNVGTIVSPKVLESLSKLWKDMYPKLSEATEDMRKEYHSLLDLSERAALDTKHTDELNKLLDRSEDSHLMNIVRALHLKVHLEELDIEMRQVEAPTAQFKKNDIHRSTSSTLPESNILSSQLVLQTFLDYLSAPPT
eukprot:TRINITY_DN2209_c0_g1_i1.p1 TRINITY_DN2209_c0_g1~~TRINITY_DN2209_c0_g1_i1.p1  ORF type:complete len:148 (-),score=25.40 TRINITY_DN2209_c0_g1_i1:64-507(-)